MLDQEKIPLLFTKSFETMSHVKGYHVYRTLWIPAMEKCLWNGRELRNPKHKYSVCAKKENRIVGHLPLGKSGEFAKTIFYSYKADELSSCKIDVTGEPVNLGDGNVMQVPRKLMLTGVKKCFDTLQKHLKQQSIFFK